MEIYSKIKSNYKEGGVTQLLERSINKASYLVFHTNNAYWFRMDLKEKIKNMQVRDGFHVHFNRTGETIQYIKDFGYFYPMEINIGLPEGHLFTSLKHNDKIIGYNKTGYGNVYIQDFKNAFKFPDNIAFAYDTFIDPKYRNQNLGAFLLNSVCENLKGLGYKSVWAHIPPWNIASISMHQKLGFKRQQLISYFWVAGVSWLTKNPVELIQQVENAFC